MKKPAEITIIKRIENDNNRFKIPSVNKNDYIEIDSKNGTIKIVCFIENKEYHENNKEL